MSPTIPRRQLSVIATALGLAALCGACDGAGSIVDTFGQGGFSITPGSGTFQEDVNLPLGSRRGADLSRWATSPGAITTSTLNSGTGKLTFVASGTSLSVFPMSLALVYGGPTLHNIAGCTEFILGFSELSGVGTLFIELGSSNGIEGVAAAEGRTWRVMPGGWPCSYSFEVARE